VDAGSLTSFFFVPFLATVSNFSTAGSGVTRRSGQRGCGRGMASARRRGSREVYSPPFGFPAVVQKRAGERTIGRVPSGRLTVNQGIRRRVHVAAVLLEHGDDIVLSLAGDRAERLNLVPRHLCVCVSLPCDRSLDSLCVPSLPRIA
jgi:hypothetical protein